MTSLLYKWVLGKAIGKVDVGKHHEDPYMEEIPPEELGIFQRRGAKRKKMLPQGLSSHDTKILKRVRNKAYQLDLVFQCCCGCQVGWSGIIGIIPGIGDMITALLALSLVRQAKKIDGGLPVYIEAQMNANVIFDFLIGLIPIVGDLINIAYKCNSRNYILLEQYLKKRKKRNDGAELAGTPHDLESSVGLQGGPYVQEPATVAPQQPKTNPVRQGATQQQQRH